jgi:hypothetical protein
MQKCSIRAYRIDAFRQWLSKNKDATLAQMHEWLLVTFGLGQQSRKRFLKLLGIER